MPHKEIAVKVNAMVDEGVADLVGVLSGIDGLVTVESCQGDGAHRDAYVLFEYGCWRQIGRLLFDELLPALSPDLRSAVSLRLQAYDVDTAVGSISVDPAAVSTLARVVATLGPAGGQEGSAGARTGHPEGQEPGA